MKGWLWLALLLLEATGLWRTAREFLHREERLRKRSERNSLSFAVAV